MPVNLFYDLNKYEDISYADPLRKVEKWGDGVVVCQCKCIERHMQSKRSVLEDDETRGRSVLSLSLLVIVIK